MHVILTGATGLIGSGILHNMLATEGITRVSILSRRPVKMAEGYEDRAKVIIHRDFAKYEPEVLEQLKDAQGVVWALGVSQNAVSKEQYFDITHDYTLKAAEAFSSLHPSMPFTFVFVSGEGATQEPGMFTPIYGRVKGHTEQALFDFGKKSPNFNVYNVRPGVVDWREHKEIHPFMPSMDWYRSPLMPIVSLYKGLMTPSRALGRVLTDLVASRGEPLQGSDVGMEGRLIPNKAIRRLAGL